MGFSIGIQFGDLVLRGASGRHQGGVWEGHLEGVLGDIRAGGRRAGGRRRPAGRPILRTGQKPEKCGFLLGLSDILAKIGENLRTVTQNEICHGKVSGSSRWGSEIIHAYLRKRSKRSAFSAHGDRFGPNPWPRAFGASRRFVYTGSYFLI